MILQKLFRHFYDVIDGESVIAENVFGRSRFAEAVNGERRSLRPDIFRPTERNSRFDRQPRRDFCRQNGFFVGGGLRIEKFPAGHRNDTRRRTCGVQFFAGFHRKPDFRTGRDQNNARFGRAALAVFGFGQDVSAFVKPFRIGEFLTVDDRDLLPRKRERRLAVRAFDGRTPSFARFVGVACTYEDEFRYRSKRREMFDRLMRWPVFAKPDRIVRENVYDLDL